MKISEEASDKLREWLERNYYSKNFGSVSKTDIDTFLFYIYYQDIKNDPNIKKDDYMIGKELGLTISRVRSLKERMELKFPTRKEDEWKHEVIKCAANAEFDEKKDLIKFSVPDVNSIKDLRHFFEENGWYDEYQLNTKLFQCRLDRFYEMCCCLDDGESKEMDWKKLDELKKKYQQEEQISIIDAIKSGHYKDAMKGLAAGAAEPFIEAIIDIVPFGSLGKSLIQAAFRSGKTILAGR